MDPLLIGGIALVVIGVVAVVALRVRRGQAREGWSRSDKLSLAGILAGTIVGVASLVIPGDDPSSGDGKAVNPAALFALIRQGPFTETLPAPLEAGAMDDIQIGDAEAAGRVGAAQLHIRYPGGDATTLTAAFAETEVYPDAASARRRAAARLAQLRQLYGASSVRGSAASYCADVQQGPAGSWECGGSDGVVYAEASIAPSANANRPLATGTVAALLQYAKEKAVLAGASN